MKLNPQTELKPGKVGYPKSETMIFADEKVAVFEKPFRLTQDVTLDKSLKPGATVVVAGTVELSGVRRQGVLSRRSRRRSVGP